MARVPSEMFGKFIENGGKRINVNYKRRTVKILKKMYGSFNNKFEHDNNTTLSLFQWTLFEYACILLLIVLLVVFAVYVFHSPSNTLSIMTVVPPVKSQITLDEFTSSTKLLAAAIVMSIIHSTSDSPSLHLLNFATTLPIVTVPRKAIDFIWQDIKHFEYQPNDFIYEEKPNSIWKLCPFGQFENKTENKRQVIYKSGQHNNMKTYTLISSSRRENEKFGSVYSFVEPGIMISNHKSNIFQILQPIYVANYEYQNTSTNCLESILILPSIDSKLKDEKPQLFVATYSSIIDENEFINSFERLDNLLAQTFNLSNEPVKSTKNILISLVMMIKLHNKDTSEYNSSAKILNTFKTLPISKYLNATILSNPNGFYRDKILNIDFSKPQNIGTMPTTYVTVKMFLTDYDLYERYGHTFDEHYQELTTLTNIVWKGVPTVSGKMVRQKRSASEGDDVISFIENIDPIIGDDYRHDGDATSIATDLSTADQYIEDNIDDLTEEPEVLDKVENLNIEDISDKSFQTFTDRFHTTLTET